MACATAYGGADDDNDDDDDHRSSDADANTSTASHIATDAEAAGGCINATDGYNVSCLTNVG